MDDAMVVMDHGGRTAILLGESESALRLVQMDAGELTVSRMDEDEFASRGFRRLDYPLGRAIDAFLAHGGGVSEAARHALVKARGSAAS